MTRSAPHLRPTPAPIAKGSLGHAQAPESVPERRLRASGLVVLPHSVLARSARSAVALLAVLALLLPALAGCASSGRIYPELPSGLSTESALARAEEHLASEEYDDAVILMAALQGERNLAPELRNASAVLAERAVDALARDASMDEGRWSAEELQELSRLNLTLNLRARLTVAAGAAHLREGSRVLAFKLLRDFEESNPSHSERAGASEVMAAAGFSLIEDPGRYGLVRRYRSRGIGALEFLVLHYPSHPRCAEAYEALASAYVERDRLDLAIERYEDLLLYHPADPRAPIAEARLPQLRMLRVDRDDFDRYELERARDELEAWLERYGEVPEVGAELLEAVQENLALCYLRLANNDLIVARFHKRIGVPFGTRQHAERALAEAALAADDGADVVAEARELLAWAQRAEGTRPRRDPGDSETPLPPSVPESLGGTQRDGVGQ